MSKVIFSIRYNIFPERRQEYLDVVRELKNIVKAEGLESYSVLNRKINPIILRDLWYIQSAEAFENFDENQERTNRFVNDKTSDMIKNNRTQYTTLTEVNT
jgi:hypothetical protein